MTQARLCHAAGVSAVERRRPWWVEPLLTGSSSGVAAAFLLRLDDDPQLSWLEAGLGGLVVALVVGAWFASTARRQQRGVAEVTDGMTPDQADAARRAVQDGPVPAEPEVRAAALRLADRALVRALRFRVLAVAGYLFLIAWSVGAAVRSSPWFLLVTVLFVVGAVGQLLEPGRLRRRREELAAEVPA